MNKKEVLRYLKYGKTEPTPEVMEIIDQCIKECEKIEPKSIYRIFHINFIDGGIILGDIEMKSEFLKKCVSGCEEAILFSATLGTQADAIIRRATVTSMTKAAVFQSVFAQYIEEYIDEMEEKIIEEKGIKKLRPRFSPGYADLSLETQKDIFRALQIEKRIGVTLTNSLLMTPSKSVTAIIGIDK